MLCRLLDHFVKGLNLLVHLLVLLTLLIHSEELLLQQLVITGLLVIHQLFQGRYLVLHLLQVFLKSSLTILCIARSVLFSVCGAKIHAPSPHMSIS